MREIKFRAWSKTANEMYNWTKILSHHNKLITYFQWDDMYNLMQYTGLKDKNGKEIYEGDIVRTDIASDWDCDVPRDEEAIIEFDNYQWWARSMKTADRHEIYDYPWKIIGNIYQDSELLK